MTCSLCGAGYPCVHTRRNTAALPDNPETFDKATQGVSPTAAEARSRGEQEHWRQEVISRVRQHRARRRRFDPNASMQFDFPADAALAVAPGLAEPLLPMLSPSADVPKHTSELEGSLDAEEVLRQPRKIIRFPRHNAVRLTDAPRLAAVNHELELELAEPAPEGPRILDAPEDAPEPEQMELLPSFTDIRLEPMEPCRNQEMDLPPQPAPLHRRFSCGLIDCAIVLLALSIFAASFAVLAGVASHTRYTLLCGLGISATLWLLFQYLFLVYGRGTPGMRATHLELLAFDGKQATPFARRGRALATTLSGFSVGLGFAWVLVDEDTLGWHDRISQTYLRSTDRLIG
jgi:uncharacterized RDD family membrane protein YckC